MPFPSGPSFMFSAVPVLVVIIFVIIFVIVIGGMLFMIGRMIFVAARNAGEPLLTRPARVIGKRQETSVSGGMNDTPASSTTWHYVTFEFDDGSREEFTLHGHDYGLLAEGDVGTLQSQGTWFKGFTCGL